MTASLMTAADLGLTADGKIDFDAMGVKGRRRWANMWYNLDSIGVRDEHYPFRAKEKDD